MNALRMPRSGTEVYLLVLLLWLAAAWPTSASEEAAYPNVARWLNVRYAKAPEGVDPDLLSLDIYGPKGAADRPVLLMVHGGGWRRGDKAGRAMTALKVPHFVAHGYVYVSVNYRLAPEAVHPTHVRDVAAAIAWLSENVRDYGGDPGRIYVMGHSAGAHLAALVATDERHLQSAGKDLKTIRGVVLLDSAAYDIPRFVNELGAGPLMRSLYTRAFGSNPTVWRDASPRRHVAPGKGIPPFLIFHTGKRIAAATLSKEFAAALKEAETPAEVVHAADKSHASLNRDIGRDGDWVTERIMDFLENCPAADAEAKPDDGTE